MIFCVAETINPKLYSFIITNKTNSSINCSETLIEYFIELSLASNIPTTSNAIIDSTILTNEKEVISTSINILQTNTKIEIPIEQTNILSFIPTIKTNIYQTDKIQIQSTILYSSKFNCFLNNSINNCFFENIDNIRDNNEIFNP